MFRRVLIVVLMLWLGACASHSSRPPSASSPMFGHKVAFALPSEEGALVQVPTAGARATVLEFFAPTCVPCRQRVPALAAKQDALAASGASLVLVAVLSDNESTEQARSALSAWGVQVDFLVDSANISQSQAGVRGLPQTMVLDAVGEVIWVAPLTATADDVVAALQR